MIFGVSISGQTAKRFHSHNSVRTGSASITEKASGNPDSLLAREIPTTASFRCPLNRQKPPLPMAGLTAL